MNAEIIRALAVMEPECIYNLPEGMEVGKHTGNPFTSKFWLNMDLSDQTREDIQVFYDEA